MVAVEQLLDLAQQAQTHGDKRQDNADDGLAAEQAAGNDQTLFLEGGVLVNWMPSLKVITPIGIMLKRKGIQAQLSFLKSNHYL